MSTYDYPKFSRYDIITVLTETNIGSVKDVDLQNPTFDSFYDLHTRILIDLDVLNEDSQMERIRPEPEEFTLLDEERRQWEAKIAQALKKMPKSAAQLQTINEHVTKKKQLLYGSGK